MNEQRILRQIELSNISNLNNLPFDFYKNNEKVIKRLLELKLINESTDEVYPYELTGNGHLACNIGFFTWYSQLGYLEDELNKLNQQTSLKEKPKSLWQKITCFF